jgi:hypothetical protein
MNNTQVKPKQTLTRSVIIPLRKPLAKMLVADFNFGFGYLNNEEKEKLIQLHKENFKEKGEGKSNLLKIERNTPEIVKFATSLENLQAYYINILFRYWINGFRLKKVEYRKDYQATYYTNRRNLPERLKYFTKKGFTLVKFTFAVRQRTANKRDLTNDSFFIKEILSLNELEYLLFHFFDIVENEKTIKNGIELIYTFLGLTEKDLKKSTFERKYFHNKKNILLRQDIFPKNLDRKLYDSEVFEIYKNHCENKLSFAAIAKESGISKNKVSNICNNPKVAAFYKTVKHYSDNYSEYLSLTPFKYPFSDQP